MIPFNNLKPLYALLAGELDAAVQRVLSSGWYILGPEVEAFEAAFAAYHGVAHAVGVANGTDAIELSLRAAGIGPGDEVLLPANTFIATALAVARAGATPVLVDVDKRFQLIDPERAAERRTPRTKAAIAVHLFGQMAPMEIL